MKNKIKPIQVGVAGEYLVAGELSLRGYLAGVTLRNTKETDIIASTNDGTRAVNIQVKSNQNGKDEWMLSKGAEAFSHPNCFYVFVAFKELGERARFFIVPSHVVSESITRYHKEWLKGKKPNGDKRKDTAMRRFKLPKMSDYEDSWETLFA